MTDKVIVTEESFKAWDGLLQHESFPELDPTQKGQMVQLLDNQAYELNTEANSLSDGSLPGAPASGTDPQGILVGVLRRLPPTMMGTHWMGMQPINSPHGTIVALHVDKVAVSGGVETATETWNSTRPDVNHSGDGSGNGMATTAAEILGKDKVAYEEDSGGEIPVYQVNPWQEMGIRIETHSVVAKSRALKAHLTMELIQDMQKLYGLNAKTILQQILAQEIKAEIDYELFAYVQSQAKQGALTALHGNTTNGVYDFDTDSDGRWADEYYRHFLRFIDREANIIGRETGRGKGNFLITSPDVVSALENIGKMSADVNIGGIVNKTPGMSYAGTLNNKFKVFVDPYASSDFVTVGYKGDDRDAGAYYCPYTPVQYMEATDADDMNKRLGVKTRYGLTHNPFADGVAQNNQYFRTFNVENLK